MKLHITLTDELLDRPEELDRVGKEIVARLRLEAVKWGRLMRLGILTGTTDHEAPVSVDLGELQAYVKAIEVDRLSRALPS